MLRLVAATLVGAAALLGGAACHAEPLALSYAAAQARYLDKSDAIDAADAGVRAAQARSAATRTLGRPDVDIEAQVLDFQKTLYLPLGSLAPVAGAFGITDPLIFRVRRFVSRPIVTATMPLYAGGRMDAARTGAASRVAIEEAARDDTAANGLAQLARTYFGRQLAARALDIRRAVVTGITAHVAAARALEREQQIAPAQRMQAEAALEEAQREAEKAGADLAAADLALAGLLRSDAAIAPTTPLAAPTGPLPPADDFVETAFDRHPGLKRLEASVRLAGAGVAAETAQLRPTVYALAQYNLDRRDTLITDPDFIFGVGLKYRIFSGQGRNADVAAARATRAQAEAGVREAQVQIETGVKVAHAQARSARERHALYGRTIAAADEALRVARLSFSALQGTSRDVTDAEIGAGRVRVEQARAAHEALDALVTLLQVSGQLERLPDFLTGTAAGGTTAP
jgi:outer membrane protein TolC